MKKLKTYVLILSSAFMTKHSKAGQPTNFERKLLLGSKIHTIRDNYFYWLKIINEVNAGNAILAVRTWTGTPYKSKQRTIKEFKGNEVGIQLLDCDHPFFISIGQYDLKYIPQIVELAHNDGLSYKDFSEWFNIDEITGQKAIIHFTKFRYGE